MSPGSIMLDLRGPELAPEEREILQHPLVGGVILFSRNYESTEQLLALTDAIHHLRRPPLLIAVDHEGGRVQRFHGQFTSLPACGLIGRRYDRAPAEALALAEQAGWLMAAELLAVGVDFSFAPVLDLDRDISRVIGDRAFHREPDAVFALARRYIKGMRSAGMSAVGKHFPGHGSVEADSHDETPVDDRDLDDILMEDLVPFERLIRAGLPAIMPAHVVFPRVDSVPAGFSAKWLGEILRRRFGFEGAVFSDDVTMAGAGVAGDLEARVAAALGAGCDMVLICNDASGAAAVLSSLTREANPASQVRLMRMHGAAPGTGLAEIRKEPAWQSAYSALAAVNRTPELGLGDDAIHS